MGRRPKDAAYETAFGNALAEMIKRRNLRHLDVAAAASLNATYLSNMLTGTKPVSPERVKSLAAAIGASAAERVQLYRSAAIDAGYVLDLAPEPDTQSST